MQHALQCFARLVRLLLGPSAIADAKLGYGCELCVLGVDVSMTTVGLQCRPARDKTSKWLMLLEQALDRGKLEPGSASKLAGKLAWGSAHLFHRLGRAMLRPIFDQKTRRDGMVDAELRRCLQWWQELLRADIAEVRKWQQASASPAHLFCDAASTPPHLGAVLLIDGKCMWTHSGAPPDILGWFRPREDGQIMGLELLAIALGLSTFEPWLTGRKVVVHSDNTGSEVSMTAFTLLMSVCTMDRSVCAEGRQGHGTMRNWCIGNGCTQQKLAWGCSSSV